ncbi:MAG: acyl carrier protein [Clostridiaceae bacterium]|jgi:acyl carrier protein|nr:acyl carrier protein [Clostridiaceae bacterium]
MDNTGKKIIQLIANVLECKESELTLKSGLLNHYKWDSLSHIMIITELEKELSIPISDDMVAQLITIEDIIKFVKTNGGK